MFWLVLLAFLSLIGAGVWHYRDTPFIVGVQQPWYFLIFKDDHPEFDEHKDGCELGVIAGIISVVILGVIISAAFGYLFYLTW